MLEPSALHNCPIWSLYNVVAGMLLEQNLMCFNLEWTLEVNKLVAVEAIGIIWETG